MFNWIKKLKFWQAASEVKLEPFIVPKINDIIEECAKIAEKYEPDEKSDSITYASRNIRKLKLKYR